MNAIILFMWLQIATPQQQTQIGYLVTIVHPETRYSKCIKTPDAAYVAHLFAHHTGLQINTAKVFTASNNFFEYRTQSVQFYCERKNRLSRRGKVTLKKYK